MPSKNQSVLFVLFNMRVLILAAGYGTRLYPLTEKIAKPLVLINDKPIINFLIENVLLRV